MNLQNPHSNSKTCKGQYFLSCQVEDDKNAEVAGRELPVSRMQLMEVIDMLQDITGIVVGSPSRCHTTAIDAYCATVLALMHVGDSKQAAEVLEEIKTEMPPEVWEQHSVCLRVEERLRNEEGNLLSGMMSADHA